MLVIPAIDVRGGMVVQARGGQRSRYRSLRSALGCTAHLSEVVGALLELHPFAVMYIADLDALEGGTMRQAWLDEAVRRFPGVEFWMDAGLPSAPPGAAAGPRRIWASESGCGPRQLRRAGSGAILSLDFHGNRLLGDGRLLDEPQCWPRRIIVMQLDRVGGGQGPDRELLRRLGARAAGRAWYAAGGIRSLPQLWELRAMGMAGALCSSILHRGHLVAGDIRALQRT